MSTIIRLKENENTAEMFAILQNTLYKGLDKTEIIRAILAEKTWLIQNQTSLNNPSHLDSKTKEKIKKAYESYKTGKTVKVKNSEIDKFLESID
jgi:uncharacterized FlgJ-related protein